MSEMSQWEAAQVIRETVRKAREAGERGVGLTAMEGIAAAMEKAANEEGPCDDFINSLDESIDRMDEEVLNRLDASPRLERLMGIIFHPDIRQWYRDKRQGGDIAPWWSKSLKK